MSKRTTLHIPDNRWATPEDVEKRRQLEELGNLMRGQTQEAGIARKLAKTKDGYDPLVLEVLVGAELRGAMRNPSFEEGLADLLYFFATVSRHLVGIPLSVKRAVFKGATDADFRQSWPRCLLPSVSKARLMVCPCRVPSWNVLTRTRYGFALAQQTT